MKPEEFTKFKDAIPLPNKHIIVTNNINARDAHGEMSHVWMTTFFNKSKQDGIVTFDAADRKICYLTHWKYA